MKESHIQSLADRTASILLSHAAHGLATSTTEGMGEITLRDGLVVAAAATGAALRQAWILKREFPPNGWNDAAVDLVIVRKGNNNTEHMVGGIEIKWWRQADAGNAANRRRDLMRDFIRAASLYQSVDSFAFVALLSLRGSWDATAKTDGSDKNAMDQLIAEGSQNWNIKNMIDSKSLKSAVKSLNGKIPIPNIFHTNLLSDFRIKKVNKTIASSKIWSVIKPQNTTILESDQLNAMID